MGRHCLEIIHENLGAPPRHPPDLRLLFATQQIMPEDYIKAFQLALIFHNRRSHLWVGKHYAKP